MPEYDLYYIQNGVPYTLDITDSDSNSIGGLVNGALFVLFEGNRKKYQCTSLEREQWKEHYGGHTSHVDNLVEKNPHLDIRENSTIVNIKFDSENKDIVNILDNLLLDYYNMVRVEPKPEK